MFKLMDFISGKKVEQQQQNANSKDKNKKAPSSPVVRSDINRVLPPHPGKNILTKTPTPPVIKVNNNNNQHQPPQPQQQKPQQPPQQPQQPQQQQPPEKPKFTRKEREEIRNTMSAFQGTEAHEILMKQLAEFELQSLADLSADVELNDSDDSESSDNSYGTFCIKDIKESNGSTSNDDESDNYGTFCMKNSNSDDDSFGTMCVSSDSKKGNNNATPDFANMFREPEEWEKYILALEKGEWVDGMAEKGAFKRWKKERPHMPSAYIRDSPFANVMKK